MWSYRHIRQWYVVLLLNNLLLAVAGAGVRYPSIPWYLLLNVGTPTLFVVHAGHTLWRRLRPTSTDDTPTINATLVALEVAVCVLWTERLVFDVMKGFLWHDGMSPCQGSLLIALNYCAIVLHVPILYVCPQQPTKEGGGCTPSTLYSTVDRTFRS